MGRNRPTEAAAASAFPVRRIHIDTDPGLDDLLALALALASPEIQVEGVTTVAGNASIDAVTENARRFLALAGLDIPLGRGAAGPLSLGRVSAEDFHGQDGRRGIEIPLPPSEAASVTAAHEVLRHSLADRQVERLVALGPLTNIAALLHEAPGLFGKVEVIWMGGTLGAGNVTPLAEFNAYADPAATAIVLGSGLPLRVIGLDVTTQVGVRSRDVSESPFGQERTGRLLWEVLRALMEAGRPTHGEPFAVLHDPCAVVAAVFGNCFRYDRMELDIRVEEGRERGRLVRSGAGSTSGVQYAVEVRAHDVRQLFLDRLATWSCGGAKS
jgi:inosine-uridine nucleoside N-ribohydrolase